MRSILTAAILIFGWTPAWGDTSVTFVNWTSKSAAEVQGEVPDTTITVVLSAESPTSESLEPNSIIDETFDWVGAAFTPNILASDALYIANAVADSVDTWRINFSQPIINPRIHFFGMERTYTFNSNIELISSTANFPVNGSQIEGIRGCDPDEGKAGTLRLSGTFTEITIVGSGISECGHQRDAIRIQVGIDLDPISLLRELTSAVMILNLNNGIENSLDAKIDRALNALDDLNENNDVAATNSLQAFINEVYAQRGNQISYSDADSLISKAQSIINLLQAL